MQPYKNSLPFYCQFEFQKSVTCPMAPMNAWSAISISKIGQWVLLIVTFGIPHAELI